MTRCLVFILVVVPALLTGCVVPYDPTSDTRIGAGATTPSRAVLPPRPSESLPPRIPGVALAEAHPPLGAAPESGPMIPGTPAGRQAAWVVGALNGQIEKKFEKRF